MKIFLLISLLTLSNYSFAQNKRRNIDTSESGISRIKAIEFIDSVKTLLQSNQWPNVQPDDFLKNVKQNIEHPLKLYSGRGTNFCGYAAVTYTCLKNEPLRYAKCMVDLYINGFANYRNIKLRPSETIKQSAGLMEYQGPLDINPADQIWFLCLAHKFKGYLNLLNLKYNKGDENTMWAATNLAKFNRMLRRLCKYKIKSRGSDLIRPRSKNIVESLKEKLSQGEVFLYLNNSLIRKKNHNRIEKRIPTHYVVLTEIREEDNLVTLKYWDGGYKTLKEISLSMLKQVLFGISWVKYKEINDEKIEE
jgi:hypothetical protein